MKNELKKGHNGSDLAISCKHLLDYVKPINKIYEIVIDGGSTFMCPQCYKHDKMYKDIQAGLIDDWITVCLDCMHGEFKKIEQIIINDKN